MIDTTNQFGPDGVEDLPDGKTAAQVNAARMPDGARYVKAFNTLTAGFQGSAAGRSGDERVAMFLCGDDDEAKETVKKLIREIGFAPVDVGGLADAAVMEAPRRDGAVYGEEFSKPEALEFLERKQQVGRRAVHRACPANAELLRRSTSCRGKAGLPARAVSGQLAVVGALAVVARLRERDVDRRVEVLLAAGSRDPDVDVVLARVVGGHG